MSVVRDVPASRAVWHGSEGALEKLDRYAIAIESSTVTPAWIDELAAAVTSRGAAFLDAPVVGSRPQADAGALIYLVGGSPETLGRAQPALASAGSAIHHVGTVGSGTLMKLATNALFASQVAALAEIIPVLERFGLDRILAAELLARLPVIGPSLQGVLAQMAARSFAPLFPIELVQKDLRCFLEAAASLEASTPTSVAVADAYDRAVHDGLGAHNISGLVELFR